MGDSIVFTVPYSVTCLARDSGYLSTCLRGEKLNYQTVAMDDF